MKSVSLLKVTLSVIVLQSCLVGAKHDFTLSIRVTKPRGFEVRISHTDGFRSAAFHGNINKPIGPQEAGELFQDVFQLEGNHWVIRYPDVQLNTGDVINYWFIVFKKKLAYVREGTYTVEEVDSSEVTTTKTVTSGGTESTCDLVVVNLTQTVTSLQRQIDSFKEINLILRDLVGKHYDTSTTLTLKGPIPAGDDDARELVKSIIREKLNLGISAKDIEKKSDEEIVFHVATLDDKVTVVKAAREKLRHSRYSIEY